VLTSIIERIGLDLARPSPQADSFEQTPPTATRALVQVDVCRIGRYVVGQHCESMLEPLELDFQDSDASTDRTLSHRAILDTTKIGDELTDDGLSAPNPPAPAVNASQQLARPHPTAGANPRMIRR
jgi:hypothetical protein